MTPLNASLRLLAPLLMFACACSSPDGNNEGTNNAERKEGTFTGDCDNGEDDDGNGVIDCDDAGCAGAPECSSGSNNGMKVAPNGWLCPDEQYDALDGCHCNCATNVRDPDCQNPNQPIVGCSNAAALCNEQGVCEVPTTCNDISTCALRECGVGTDGCTPCGPACPVGEVCVMGTCETQMNNNGTNNSNNTTNNQIDPNAPYLLRIVDTTTGTELCDIPDSGADLFGVALQDSTGQVLAWGKTFVTYFTSQQYDDPFVIFGQDPMLEADGCPVDFSEETIFSLGCGGWVAVTFEQAPDMPYRLDPALDFTVVVHEYGEQCAAGGNDTFDVTICTEPEQVRNDGFQSCTIQLVSAGSGEVGIPVQY